MGVDDHRLIFLGGLHRSGTTPLARIMGQHPSISSLSHTGVPEDEGQHLQSLYPPATSHGGSGHFARRPQAHLTETSTLVSARSVNSLWESWSPHWDLSRPYLLEKSPPNLLMSRFLQALFPRASFIMVVRHPITVALSTRKWTHFFSRNPRKFATLSRLVGHWLHAHRLLAGDLPHLDRVRVVYYEDLVRQPQLTLDRLRTFLDLDSDIPSDMVSGDRGQSYEQWWEALDSLARPGGWQRRWIERRYAEQIANYGYDVHDLSTHQSAVSQLPESGS